jgi:CheY-like chemotaxis protein
MDAFFRLLGHETKLARSGEEALKLYSDCDVVIMDQEMPGLSGLETITRMRSAAWHRPVFLVTGSGGLSEEAARAGVKSVLLKPVRMKDLEQLIRDSVSHNPTE